VLILLFKNYLKIYFEVPNIFVRLQEPLRGHTTRKNEVVDRVCDWELVSYWPVLLYFGLESVDYFLDAISFFEFPYDIFFNMITVLQLVVLNQNHGCMFCSMFCMLQGKYVGRTIDNNNMEKVYCIFMYVTAFYSLF
jgi:hypothetical protein